MLLAEPGEGGRTRLIARTRGGWLEPFARRILLIWPVLWPVAAFIDRCPGEILHHYMEAGMLKGVKERAEAAHQVPLSCDGLASTLQRRSAART